MLEFTAHSDGRVIVPDEPVEIPQGRSLRVHVEEIQEDAKPHSSREALLRIAREAEELNPNLPTDLAENLDHYLYGASNQ